MPYIKADDGRREALRKGEPALSAGELNYQIFYFVKHHRREEERSFCRVFAKACVDSFLGEKPNYQRYNDMTGALVRCSKEIQRRLGIQAQILIDIMLSYDEPIAIYEDIKIKENGDVE